MNRYLTATLLGVAIGMLIAPQKGSETRTSITENFERIREYINKILGKAKEDVQELRCNLEKELEGLDDIIKAKVLHIFDEAAALKQMKKQRELN